MLCVTIKSIMLNAIVLSVIMLSVIMLSVIMLSVIMLSVIMLGQQFMYHDAINYSLEEFYSACPHYECY